MYYPATSTRLKVDARAPALNGGWWSPYQRQAPIALGSMPQGVLVLQQATSKARYESDLSSDVAIWTPSN